jgi:hypothetical protein
MTPLQQNATETLSAADAVTWVTTAVNRDERQIRTTATKQCNDLPDFKHLPDSSSNYLFKTP